MATRILRQTSHFRYLAILLAGLLLPATILAQQAIVPLQLSVSDPGARSMGFGGAFVALGDDATAAFANPAGLVQLLKPEVSIEWRHRSYSEPYTKAGRIEGVPTGIGIDTLDGLVAAKSDKEVAGLSFLSFAWPLDKWTFAIYRHEYARHEFAGATQGLFGVGSACCQPRYVDQWATSELDFVSYGFSAAWRIRDEFSLGLGLVYHDASIVASVSQFFPDDDTPESRFLANSYLPERSILTLRNTSSDTDLTLTGGFLWRPSENWSVGGVYRQGLETEFRIEARAGEAVDFGVPPGDVILRGNSGPVEFPDIYGAGIAYRRPDGRFTASFQWDRIEYSSIPKSLDVDDQTIDDASEWHLGAEYVFIDSTPIVALRLGAWLDPDHQMRAISDDPFTRALLPPGEDEWHYSVGLGIAMERFQVDLAVDVGERLNTVALSAVYNF
jgi:long-subunit fatty acid transport protein